MKERGAGSWERSGRYKRPSPTWWTAAFEPCLARPRGAGSLLPALCSLVPPIKRFPPSPYLIPCQRI
jgi:hypothetical protein